MHLLRDKAGCVRILQSKMGRCIKLIEQRDRRGGHRFSFTYGSGWALRAFFAQKKVDECSNRNTQPSSVAFLQPKRINNLRKRQGLEKIFYSSNVVWLRRRHLVEPVFWQNAKKQSGFCFIAKKGWYAHQRNILKIQPKEVFKGWGMFHIDARHWIWRA